MSRLFVYDETCTNVNAKLTTAKLSAMANCVSQIPNFIQWQSSTTFRILAGTCISIGNTIFNISETLVVDATSNIDGGSLSYGNDYYIYLCDDGILGNEVIKVSLNSAFPTGYTSDNSRKIGGFHYGYYRPCSDALIPINSEGTEWGTNWKTNINLGIVPRSVWTLKHRPSCSPEGMIYLTSGVWVDIYEASSDGAGGLISAAGASPLGGSNGENWYTLSEKAIASGKRFISYNEWCLAAFGSPVGENNNTYAYTSTSNTTKALTGSVSYAVSACGVRDAVGNLWEMVADLYGAVSGTTWTWRSCYNYDHPYGASGGFGNIYTSVVDCTRMILCGGDFMSSSDAGDRAVNVGITPYNAANPRNGVRLGCNSI